MSTAWSFETRQIHAGQSPDSQTNARALPIYQSTAFTFDSSEHAANLFALREFGNIYSRIMNPTHAVVEDRIASLEGGVGALLVSSGQAAETIAILNLAGGRRSRGLESFAIRRHVQPLPLHAAEAGHRGHVRRRPRRPRAVARRDPPEHEGALRRDRSRIRRTTSSTSRAWRRSRTQTGVPLMIDNTVATPYLIRPFEWGADIVVHSATKYLGGHGTTIAGFIVDGGSFDFASEPERFPNFTEPDPSLPRARVRADLGVGSALGADLAYILKARVQLLRDLGSSSSPFNAFLIAPGPGDAEPSRRAARAERAGGGRVAAGP